MILADENIDHNVIQSLRQADIDVHSIREQHRGITDREVIEVSRNPPRIILTEDKDFGEWVFAHQVQDISVILLRYPYEKTAEITSILTNLLHDRSSELFGSFTTITPEKTRIRKLK